MVSLGSLDTYGAASYQLRFTVQTHLTVGGTADDLIVGGTILERKGREGIVVNAIKVSYTSDPPLTGFKDFTLPIILMPGDSDNSKFFIAPKEIIGPETAKVLMGLRENHDPVTLYAKIVFQGYTQRGGVKVASGPAIFPIIVTKDPLSPCIKPLLDNGCFYPGQDHAFTGKYRCCDGLCLDGGTTAGGGCTPPPGCE